MRPAFICRTCEHRQRECRGGACLCAISGRDVIEHQTRSGCPLKLFAAAVAGVVDPLDDVEREIVAAANARPEGFGDTLKTLLGKLGAERATRLYKRLTGRACRCDDRREWLNRWWPYRMQGEAK